MSTIDKLIRRQIKLTILSVIAVVLITSTITYALYQTNHENTTDQVISIGNLGLTATGTPITLEGLYPMEEYDLTSSYPSYNFTLENKTNNVNNDYTLMYELILRADENTTLSQDDYQYIMYKIDGSDAKALSEVWDSEINGFKILDGRLLSHDETTLSTDFANKDIENHSIVFWLSTYAPNSVQGKVLMLKMSLEAYADRFNYLKYYGYGKTNVFGKNMNRDLFESITTLDIRDVPENAIDSWDVSQKQNGSIMAWYTDEDNSGSYELYIGQNEGVFTNPNSTNLFFEYRELVSIDLQHLNTSLTTSMNSFFANDINLQNVDVSSFDTSNVTVMSNMFCNLYKVQSITGLTSFNTSNVINMYSMFFDLFAMLNDIDVSSFDTSNVTVMSNMFHSLRSKNLDLSSFNTLKVTNMQDMFSNTYLLTNLNISNMNFDNVNNYSNFFNSNTNNNVKIITNECAEEFVRARLAEAGRSSVTLEVVPCIKICYSNNINNLPSEYTELEYIESTGTQYIDSGYKPTPSTGVYADFKFTSTTTQQRLYGISSWGGTNLLSYDFYITSSNKYGYSFNNNSGNWIDTNITIDKNRHTLSFNVNNDRKVYIDAGETYSADISGSPTNTSPYNMYIIATYNSNHYNAYVKLYSFKIYENGTLVRNYIPALRKSNNAIGLYETEEGKFYENSGTGVFNLNGGMQIKTGNTIQLISTISARPGYTFVGWNTKPDGTGTTFKQGEVVDASVLKSLGEDTITLYAMWEAN